jgi:hypothetical protein
MLTPKISIIQSIKYIYSLSFCLYLHLFALAFPIYNLLFFLRLRDVLGGLPTLEQPYMHQLRQGPSRADDRRSTAGSSRHPGLTTLHRWSDRPSQRNYSELSPRAC